MPPWFWLRNLALTKNQMELGQFFHGIVVSASKAFPRSCMKAWQRVQLPRFGRGSLLEVCSHLMVWSKLRCWALRGQVNSLSGRDERQSEPNCQETETQTGVSAHTRAPRERWVCPASCGANTQQDPNQHVRWRFEQAEQAAATTIEGSKLT
jgi:hypothetical protein